MKGKGKNMETLIYGIIIYLIVMSIANALLALGSMREHMNKKALGGTDLITGMISLVLWNYFFRGTNYVSEVLFWVVFAGCFLMTIIGFVNLVIGVFSEDPRW